MLQHVPCFHCGLPAPPPNEKNELAFCCNGCRGAYELIEQWGLDSFYDLRGSEEGQKVRDGSAKFEDLDQPHLLGKSAPLAVESSSGALRSKLAVYGIHCAACSWLLETAPSRVDGWLNSKVNMHEHTIEIIFDPEKVRLSAIASLLARFGYTLSPITESNDQEQDLEIRKLLVHIAVAGFCAANAMWLAIALYAGEFTGIDSSHAHFLRMAGVALGLVAVIFPGRIFFVSATASLRSRLPHMDVPVAIGLAAGAIGSVIGVVDLGRAVYFDSVAALVFFLLLGRWLQIRQQRIAGEEITQFLRLTPTVCTKINSDGNQVRMNVNEIVKDDQILVNPNEPIPIDGEITDGKSSIDRALLTGESMPIAVGVGDLVEAGTNNLYEPLTVTATSAFSDSRLASLQDTVSKAASSRTPIIQMANRLGGWFVAAVVGLTVVNGAYLAWTAPEHLIERTVTLLIVACPCALALATPLAIAMAIGRLAADKVLVRRGECLESIQRPGTIYFDKTGTLTTGRPTIREFYGDSKFLNLAATIERNLNHPVSLAIVEHANATLERSGVFDETDSRNNRQEDVAVEGLSYQPGIGVTATVAKLGTVKIGNEQVLHSATNAKLFRKQWKSITHESSSPVAMTIDGQVVGLWAITDTLRSESALVVEKLRSLGWKIGILSGDHSETVHRVGRELNLNPALVHGSCSPEQKLMEVHRAKKSQTVVMVGDGLNDAAALAAADVGIAIRNGVASTLSAAPVIVSGSDIKGIMRFIAACRITRRTIILNFVISILYNLFAISLAIAGYISPLVAAVIMPISSLSVIFSSIAGVRKINAENLSIDNRPNFGAHDTNQLDTELTPA